MHLASRPQQVLCHEQPGCLTVGWLPWERRPREQHEWPGFPMAACSPRPQQSAATPVRRTVSKGHQFSLALQPLMTGQSCLACRSVIVAKLLWVLVPKMTDPAFLAACE